MTSAAALVGYAVLSFLYFGIRLLPHPGRYVLGTGFDPDIFVWMFAWWPHAILHGENPIVTHAIWAPDGINLAWTTSIPALALAFAPVTLAFGPVVAYNLAALLLPPLAAWTAFLLCRHVTGSTWPSLAGGYLFGFSSYMLGQELGHMHMTSVFLVPLVALTVLRFVEGGVDGRGLVWRLGPMLALQLALSTELFFTVSFSLAAAGAVAWAVVPAVRARLRALLRPLAVAYALACVLAGPLLYYVFSDFKAGTVNEPDEYSADVVNFFVPTHLIALGTSWTNDLTLRFQGNDAERGAYIGLPALVVVGWFLLRRRRTPAGRFLGALLALALAVELGSALWVAGHRLIPLPWDLVTQLPVFNNVLPARFALFASLVVAVIVALWAASPLASRRLRIALAAAAVLALVPTIRQANWWEHPERPEFFAHPELLAACLPPGENEIVTPYAFHGHSMLYQAESGFRFRMAGGYVRPDTPDSFDYAAVTAMNEGSDPTVPQLLELARAKGVDRVLSLDRYQHPSTDELKGLGPVQVLGGVIVAPACGHPGIADRSRSSSP